jgi:hypothetical protein
MVIVTPPDTASFGTSLRWAIHDENFLLYLLPSFDLYRLVLEALDDSGLPRHPEHFEAPVQDIYRNNPPYIMSFNTTHVWELLWDDYPPQLA